MMRFIQNRMYHLAELRAQCQNWKGESEAMSGFQELNIPVDNDLETNVLSAVDNQHTEEGQACLMG